MKFHKFADLEINTINEWKNKGSVVFTNGCFDILHAGHIEYLMKAKELGDILVVGLNSDLSIKRLKGEKRPYTDELSRGLILSSLFFIDAVVLFEEDTPLSVIKFISPDILVKGKDYKEENIVGYEFMKNKGSKIMTIELTEGYSTTKIIDKINDRLY